MQLVGVQNQKSLEDFWIISQVHEMIYMKMTNGEYIYGTNLDIGNIVSNTNVNANVSLPRTTMC